MSLRPQTPRPAPRRSRQCLTAGESRPRSPASPVDSRQPELPMLRTSDSAVADSGEHSGSAEPRPSAPAAAAMAQSRPTTAADSGQLERRSAPMDSGEPQPHARLATAADSGQLELRPPAVAEPAQQRRAAVPEPSQPLPPVDSAQPLQRPVSPDPQQPSPEDSASQAELPIPPQRPAPGADPELPMALRPPTGDQSALPMSLRPPASPAAAGLLAQARRGLAEAERETRPAERFIGAYLAALRGAAAVLAARGRPHRGRARPASTWVLLDSVAPELREWSAFFASNSATRAAAQAGITGKVTAESADGLVRAATPFLELVRRLVHGLPITGEAHVA